jgi:hypothetical protein
VNHSPELTRLQQSVRESRLGISREYAGLLSDLDLQKRFTESVKRHPLGWIGGAAAAGLLATLFGGRRKASSVSGKSPRQAASPAVETAGASSLSKAGWIAGALEVGKLLYPVLRPVVVEFVSNAARAGLAKRGRLQ